MAKINLGSRFIASPDFPLTAEFEKARALEKNGKIEEAKELYIKISSAAREFYGAHGRLAVLFRKEGNFDSELQIITHALFLIAFYWDEFAEELSKKSDWPESPVAKAVSTKNQLKVLDNWSLRLRKLLEIRRRELEKKVKQETAP